MNRKNILANIWKFSAAKAVAFMLLVPSMGSFFVIGSFYLYLEQSKDDVLFTNIAGQQRMLSEQLGAYVQMVHHLGQEDDREPLKELVAVFDQSLVVLDQGGIVMGRRLSPPPPEIRNSINRVKQLWQDLKPAIVLVADQPASSPQAIKANNFIQVSIPRLRDLSNEVVVRFELLTNNKKTQVFRIIITVLSVNFVLLLIGILVTKRYLDERKRTEKRLTRFSRIFEDSLNEIYLFDADNLKFSQVNSASQQNLGYTMAELQKLTPLDIKPEFTKESFAQLVSPLTKGEKQKIVFETVHRRKDKSLYNVEVHLQLIKFENETFFAAIIMDITERKLAEEAKKQADKEISLLNTIMQAIYETEDLHLALEVVLREVCRATGWVFGESWIPNSEGTVLECNTAWYSSVDGLEKFRKLSEKITFPPAGGLPGRVWLSQEPEWIEDVSTEPESVFYRSQIALEAGFKAGFGVPIITNERVLAILVFFTVEFYKKDRHLLEFISAIASQLSSVIQRKQAEEALRASKAYSENILSSMTDALFVITSDAIIETVNTTATTLLGYTEDELIGKPLGMVFEEDGEDTFTHQVMSMSEDKLQVIYDHDPKDFWHLLKTADLGIVIVDSDGKIVMINEETESIFGYGKRDLIGKTIHVLLRGKLRNVHEKERVEYMASPSQRYMGKERFLKAQRKDGTTFEVEIGLVPLQIDGETQVVSVIRDTASKEKWEFIKHTRFGRLFSEEEVYWNVDQTLVDKNGKKIPVLMSGAAISDDSGEIQGAVLVAKDITERKAAQMEIERLANFPRLNPMPVVEMNQDCIATYINPATEAILKRLGLSKSQVNNILPDDCKQMVKDGLEKGGEISFREVHLGDRILLWSGYSLKESNLFHFYATDITERVKSRKKIEEALDKAEQADQVKSLFLANMSHEIRTPLNAILGFTELIEMSTRHLVSEEEQEFFNTIKNSGTRLMNTVHKILDITQIESGTYELKMEQLDLSKLVEELVHAYQPTAEDKNLELTYKSNIDSAYIQADENGLSQAINNIIDNAIKYTEQGKITMLLKQLSKHYILSIQDTGIGISKEYLDKLFEVFTQESEGYTKKYQGIGLGISIAKRLLDLNHVDINVESAKGIGTTFTLTFKPVKKRILEKQVEKDEAKIIPTVEPAEKPFVLVVEDDHASQKLIEFFIKETHDMCFAVSIMEAKQQLKKYPIDLILLDLSLVGNEDGLDLVRWMRKTKTWKKTPVIATTAHAFTKDRDNCIAAGCNDYLSKPIKRENLLEKIRKHF